MKVYFNFEKIDAFIIFMRGKRKPHTKMGGVVARCNYIIGTLLQTWTTQANSD